MEKNKKMYILFVVVVVVLMLLAALAGAGIAIHFNNNDEDTSVSDNVNTPVEDPSATVNPTGTVELPTGNELPTNMAATGIVDLDPTNVTDPAEDATTVGGPVTVGPYTTGNYYFYNADGKNLKLRASASVDVDTGVEIPSGAKLVVKQIIASDVPEYPYWGATSYKGTDGYVAMQFLMTAADYEAQFGNQVNADSGEYTVGTYMVATGGYGIKVKDAPGDGDDLTVVGDGEEFEVLDIQVWNDAPEEDRVYWGHIEWGGWDAYVPMYYMEKVA